VGFGFQAGSLRSDSGGQGCVSADPSSRREVGLWLGPANMSEHGRRLTAKQARTPSLGLARICLWPGTQVDTSSGTWTRLAALFDGASQAVAKLCKVTQADGKRRVDVFCSADAADRLLTAINSVGSRRWGWYARLHEPYAARFGRQHASQPRAAPTARFSTQFTVVTLNINGVSSKVHELSGALSKARIDVLLLQETRLSVEDRRLLLPGYTCYNAPAMSNNAAADRGLATAVRSSLVSHELSELSGPGCLC
jgi:hypothetical protein